MSRWVTSDLHFFHKNIFSFCGATRPWASVEEMHEALIEEWNNKVKRNHIIYHLGDFSFGKEAPTRAILERLNGDKVFIIGNHDKKLEKIYGEYGEVFDYYETSHNKVKICMSHYPFHEWNQMHRGAVMLHGHCVDSATEILTTEGWVGCDTVKRGMSILNYNPTTRKVEKDVVKEIIVNNYSGKVFSFKGKSVNFRVTSDHKMVGLSYKGEYIECLAKDLLNERVHRFIRAGDLEGGLEALGRFASLLAVCAADGNLKVETGLWRVIIKRDRKISSVRNLLESLEVPFKVYPQKDGSLSFNFYAPQEFSDFRVKGLDWRLLDMSKDQFQDFLYGYSISDGSLNGRGILISTSRESEKDIISAMAVIHGYGCTILERPPRGFSKNKSWQLSIMPSSKQAIGGISQRMVTEEVSGEKFWCIETNNGNFFMRREGKIHLTGNCHGTLPPHPGRRLDVGYDSLGAITLLEDVVDFMLTKDIYIPEGGHGYDGNRKQYVQKIPSS